MSSSSHHFEDYVTEWFSANIEEFSFLEVILISGSDTKIDVDRN